MSRNRRTLLLMLLVLLSTASTLLPATLKVSGAGLWRDYELRVSLGRLLSPGEKSTLDANALEDAAVILLAALAEEGFQTPKLEIVARLNDGSEQRFEFDPTFARALPRTLQVPTVVFRVTPGVR